MNIEKLLMLAAVSAMGIPLQRLHEVFNMDDLVKEAEAFVDAKSDEDLEELVVSAVINAFPKHLK